MDKRFSSAVHHSNLVPGQTVYLKSRWGEAAVQIIEQTMEGWLVEVKQGGFRPPLKKYGKGDQFVVPDDWGQFYELKA